MVRESVSPQVRFDADLARELAAPGGGDLPVIATMAGHDAGVLSAAGVPTAMLFVRNPTGVSHAPDEHAGTADCLAGRRGAGRHAAAAGHVTTYWLERAWTGSGPVRAGLVVDVEDGVFTRVEDGPARRARPGWPG